MAAVAEKSVAERLAELRERKAQLLEAKALPAKIAAAKQAEAAAKARAEYWENIEEGKSRGYRGEKLIAEAARLAEEKRLARLAGEDKQEAKDKKEDDSRPPCDSLSGREAQQNKDEATEKQEDDSGPPADGVPEKKAQEDQDEAKENQENNSGPLTDGLSEKNDQEEVDSEDFGADDSDEVDGLDEVVNFLSAPVSVPRYLSVKSDNVDGSDNVVNVLEAPADVPEYLMYRRSQREQTEEQKAETERRRQQANFVAGLPTKTSGGKAVHSKKARGRQNSNSLVSNSKSAPAKGLKKTPYRTAVSGASFLNPKG
jgi:hypothetical protein